jgi:hypothetical protein
MWIVSFWWRVRKGKVVEGKGRPRLGGCLDKDSVHGHCLENEVASVSHNPVGLHALLHR